jgi:hypothetical protein
LSSCSHSMRMENTTVVPQPPTQWDGGEDEPRWYRILLPQAP